MRISIILFIICLGCFFVFSHVQASTGDVDRVVTGIIKVPYQRSIRMTRLAKKLSPHNQKKLVKRLIKILDKKQVGDSIRGDIIEVLGGLGPVSKPAIPSILGCIEDDWASCSIEKVMYKISPDAIPLIVEELKRPHKNKCARAHLLSALKNYGPDARSAIPFLVEQLEKRKDTDTVLIAVGNQCLPAMYRLIDRTLSNKVIEKSTTVIYKLEKDPKQLVKLLEHKNKSVVGWSLLCCGDLDRTTLKSLAPTLAKLLNSSKFRYKAERQLQLLGKSALEAAPSIRNRLSLSDPKDKAEAALFVLSLDKNSQAAKSTLLNMVQSPDWDDRSLGILYLGKAKPDEGVDALIQVLNTDRSARLRTYAAISLGNYGSLASKAIPALQEASKIQHPEIGRGCCSETPQVQDAAIKAIAQIRSNREYP